MIAKGAQGQDRFRRPRSECHNRPVPEIQPTTFKKHFMQRFERKMSS
jgi:hypothetical protein